MAKTMRQVLVIDDEAAMRHMLRLVLERDGYAVSEAANGHAGLEQMLATAFDYILCDIRMPELDGPGFLQEKERHQLGGTVIMMSAYGTIDTAVECMKQGAYDYISKPFRPDEILLALRKAEERLQLSQENLRLRDNLRRSGRPQGTAAIVHRSALMAELLETVRRTAASQVPVLITGETGTGKELVARALHAESPRCGRPFLALNCGAIPAGLLESELFGHVRGAFTGADRARTGLFGAANGGTLLLDEIGDLPLELQPKLLRVLQEGEVRRVGDNQSVPVDVRVVAATALDLRQAVAAGRFREDLYYRLAVVTIELPPLRRRPEDIAPLVRSCLPHLAARHGRPLPELTAEALQLLEQYPWPGNVRELLNVLEKTLVLCREETIVAGDIVLGKMPTAASGVAVDLSLKKAVAELERDYICRALAATSGNRTQAARLLEISLRNLLYKLKEYGLHN
jgi:two-component system response regulator AtoC